MLPFILIPVDLTWTSIFLRRAVCNWEAKLTQFLRHQGFLPSLWPLLRRTLHLDTDDVEGNELTAFLKKDTAFKVAFLRYC
jgi:hypothetical protein